MLCLSASEINFTLESQKLIEQINLLKAAKQAEGFGDNNNNNNNNSNNNNNNNNNYGGYNDNNNFQNGNY